MSPVILGLILAAPMTWLTSRSAARPLRRYCRRARPQPPAIVESASRAHGEWAARIALR